MTPPPRPPPWLPASAVVPLLLLLGIYLAGAGAVVFAPPGSEVAQWWPAAGLAVTLMAVSPRRAWPTLAVAIVLVSGAANLTGGRDLQVSTLFGVANAAEAVIAGWFLRRGRRDSIRLDSQDDFIRLVAAAILGGATVATLAGLIVSTLEGGSFLEVWRAVAPSHAAAVLVLVPVAMSLRPHGLLGQDEPQASAWERWLQAGVLVVVTLLIFAPAQTLPLVFLPLPFLVWAALRLDTRTVAWELAAFSVVTTLLTARGFGPFGNSLAVGRINDAGVGAVMQAYLACAAFMSLPLAIAVAQRHRLLERVSTSEQLFRRNFTESLVGMLLLRGHDTRLEIIDINDTASRVLGTDHGPLLGRSLDSLLETRSQLDEVAARLIAGHQDAWRAQTGLKDRPGARVNVSLSPLSLSPEPIFAAQLQDVTAEYEARRRLEEAEQLTSATLDTTACIILVTDLEGTIIRTNAAASRLTGWAEDELLGRPVWQTTLSPNGAAELQSLFTLPERLPGSTTVEADAMTRSGQRLRIVWNNNLVTDDHDRPKYAVLTGVDVTAERTTSGLMTHLLEAAITTALIGTDTKGRITVFNSGAQRLLGYSSREMLGEPFARLIEPGQLLARTQESDPDRAFAVLVDETFETDLRDWTWVARNGEPHTISMTLSAAADEFAAQVGFLCVGRDVTEQRQTQEMLVAALDKERTAVVRLRQLDEAKNEFVSTVSHELRTPVTSIVGYTEMLTDGSIVEPDPDQLPLLATIARNGERLIGICNDLLLLGGIDSGAAHWEQEILDLTTLIGPVDESIRHLLKERRLTLEFITPDQPLLVQGDRAQLERVLINLLSNAVKFTEDGGSITCRLERQDAEARIIVSDTGIGIPAAEQDGLFQRFFRSSTAQRRAIQGTGLGLSIVATIVAAHGGEISVESVEGQGTEFTVRLPRKVPNLVD